MDNESIKLNKMEAFKLLFTLVNNFDFKPNATSIISYAEMPESITQMTGI
jgi:hypothetical protein